MRLGKFLSRILGSSQPTGTQKAGPSRRGEHDPEEVMRICRDAGGDWERQAAACLVATTLLDDDDAISEAYYFRGNALEELGRYDEAIAAYDDAIALDPNYVEALANRGLTFRRKGDHAGARRDYDAAIRINPEHRETRMNRAVLSNQQEAYQDALEDLDYLLARDPNDIPALVNRSITYRGLGDMVSAMQDIDLAIDLVPASSELRIHRAEYHEHLGTHDMAKQDLIMAIAADPGDPSGHAALADLLAFGDESVRDLKVALGHQIMAANSTPEDPRERHQLAIIATMAGDVEQAVAAWEHLIAMAGITGKFQTELHDKGYLDESNMTGEWDETSRAALTEYVRDGRLPFDEQAD